MIVTVPAIGKNGIVQDAPIGDMPVDSFTDAANVRFRDGMIELVYGHAELSTDASLSPSSFSPHFCMHVAARTGAGPNLLMLSDTKAYFSQRSSQNWVELTNAGGDYTAGGWVGGVLTGIPVVTNGTEPPQAWTAPGTGAALSDLANWDSGYRCDSIRPFRNFLIAMAITPYPSGDKLWHRVWWSHPADPGSVPSSWDVTDATKLAGWLDIPDDSVLIDGGALRDRFVLYKERSTYMMTYVGGIKVFRIDLVFTEHGILNRNCWAELDGHHVVLTQTDLIMHDGMSAKSILDRRMRRWLFQNIDADATDKCFLTKQHYFSEIWVCFPSQGATWCDKALVWNWKDNTCSLRDLPNISHAALGPSDPSVESAWDNDPAAWDSDGSGWGSDEFTPDSQRVVMVSPVTDTIYLADSTSRFDGTAISAYVERKGLTLGDASKRKLIRGIRPRLYGGQNDVDLYIGSHEELHGEVTWSGPQTFSINTDFKSDFLVDGRYIAFKLASTSETWRLESVDFDVETVTEY
jgi:hypothetical protein